MELIPEGYHSEFGTQSHNKSEMLGDDSHETPCGVCIFYIVRLLFYQVSFISLSIP
jgi:hypothetical protein